MICVGRSSVLKWEAYSGPKPISGSSGGPDIGLLCQNLRSVAQVKPMGMKLVKCHFTNLKTKQQQQKRFKKFVLTKHMGKSNHLEPSLSISLFWFLLFIVFISIAHVIFIIYFHLPSKYQLQKGKRFFQFCLVTRIASNI